MLELGNIVRVSYGANVISEACSKAVDSVTAPDDADAAATIPIQYLLRGKIDESRQKTQYAGEAVSTTQALADTATNIGKKLIEMKKLAEDAAEENRTEKELEEMQEKFEKLAKEINDITENTKCSGNKFFSTEGKNFSVNIGNGSEIDFAAKDLGFDAEGLDLTADADAAKNAVDAAIEKSGSYIGYINEQADRLGKAAMLIEYEVNNAFGVKADDFNTNTAKEIAAAAAKQTAEDMSKLLQTQGNLSPDKVSQLLKDKDNPNETTLSGSAWDEEKNKENE